MGERSAGKGKTVFVNNKRLCGDKESKYVDGKRWKKVGEGGIMRVEEVGKFLILRRLCDEVYIL